MEKYKVVILGENGFIGSNLKEFLSFKREIELSSTKNINLLGFKELKNFFIRVQPKIIINSAFIGVNSNKKYSKKYLSENLKIVKNILKAATYINNLKKIIFLGSSLEYDDSNKPIHENYQTKPKNAYALVKMKTTLFSLDFSRRKKIPLIILRPFNLYGPHDEKSIIYVLIASLLRNGKIKLSKGEQIRDYLYINDFSKIIYKIIRNIDKFENFQVYNVASSIPIKLSKIFKEIFKSLNKDYKYTIIPYRQKEYMSHVGDISKIRKIITVDKLTPLNKGIKETISWVKSQSHLK
ncbi:MAG: hypothetical protein COU25_01130 [Candidatus Levybacteria bacterium CG10_big_fil_rev_8_21_14_0_10_35_13]|nr:MAG: hypothetical protein COU25_01130 [Candidatus Levybacteria bacterium CG10_big_fil_rev_8_21_14_0_10_35_13]